MPQPRSVCPALRFLLPVACVAVVLVAVGAGSAAGASGSCGRGSLTPRRHNLRRIARIVLCLVNEQRVADGLQPLRANAALGRAAREHSADMVARGYFSHYTPRGAGPVHRIAHAGYAACSLGENIAAGTGRLTTPTAIVNAWMREPGHRAVVLQRSFRDSGVGVAYGFPGGPLTGGATYTEDFGGRC